MAIIMRGLRGKLVKRVQEKLGVDADGIFGPGTERALKEYQENHGLTVDGIAGPNTLAALGLFEGGGDFDMSAWDDLEEEEEGALDKASGWFGFAKSAAEDAESETTA